MEVLTDQTSVSVAYTEAVITKDITGKEVTGVAQSIIPIMVYDSNIIVKAEAYESSLAVGATIEDFNRIKYKKYTVVGIGNTVKCYKIGDKVQVNLNSCEVLDLSTNELAFIRVAPDITKHLKQMNKLISHKVDPLLDIVIVDYFKVPESIVLCKIME
jgi:hypothetical protein